MEAGMFKKDGSRHYR